MAGRGVRDVARDVLAVAREGLKRRARFSGAMIDETGYLAVLDEIVDSGLTQADRLLDHYNGGWRGEVTPVYDVAAY